MPDEPKSDVTSDATSPVRLLPGEQAGRPGSGVALCLSGGGYRAMLFHLGALIRLNELGWLPVLDRVSSVSGGSITAGVLGVNWQKLLFDAAGVATNFQELVIRPVRKLAAETLDQFAIITGILTPGSIAEKVVSAYNKYLFQGATLQDLPEHPRFILNATSVQSLVLVRFSRKYVADYMVGMIDAPSIQMAQAVAASSAFPPFLSPLVVDVEPGLMRPAEGATLHREPFTTRMVLTDGGVYDNLGLETAYKRCRTLLVSDGGGQPDAQPKPDTDWGRHTYRVLNIIDNQVRSLRKRQLIQAYIRKEREGCYWGIRSDIRQYEDPPALDCPYNRTMLLAETPTRLAELEGRAQERIINWGYAICDAAMRKHVIKGAAAPAGFPYPDSGIGQ